MDAPLRVGFVSTAQIGRKVSWAAKEAGASLLAVASRDVAKAQAFASAWGFEQAYGSYEELLADPLIEAVYIPLPTALHKEWVIAAAESGKHVLVDKPCATSLAELAEMIAVCDRAGVQFMDNTMFMHNRRLVEVERYLRGPTPHLGAIRSLSAAFCFNGDAHFLSSNIRTSSLEPAGCVGDIGHYCIRIALFAFGYSRAPAAVTAVAHTRAGGNPSDVTATIYYDAGDGDDGIPPHATFTCSFHSAFRQTVEIAGTRGTLAMDDFVLNRTPRSAFSVVLDPAAVDLDRGVRSDVQRIELETPHGHQEVALWAKFAALVRGGVRDPFWPRVAMLTQAVQDAVMESIARDGAKVTVVKL